MSSQSARQRLSTHTDERGKKLEPMELAYIDVPDEFSGNVIQKLAQRKGELQGMSADNGGYTRLEFSDSVPAASSATAGNS